MLLTCFIKHFQIQVCSSVLISNLGKVGLLLWKSLNKKPLYFQDALDKAFPWYQGHMRPTHKPVEESQEMTSPQNIDEEKPQETDADVLKMDVILVRFWYLGEEKSWFLRLWDILMFWMLF